MGIHSQRRDQEEVRREEARESIGVSGEDEDGRWQRRLGKAGGGGCCQMRSDEQMKSGFPGELG